MEITIIAYLVVGLVLLVVGADLLVKGASKLALRLGITPIVVGLTVVAFGTSAPELAISVSGAMQGKSDIAVGNVIGSNIFNILFILGASAMIVPLTVHRQIIRLDVPILIIVSIVVYFMAFTGSYNKLDGILLSLGLIVYVWFTVKQSKKEKGSASDLDDTIEPVSKKDKTPVLILFIVFGLALLVLGSQSFVTGAVDLAKLLGVSDIIIGLTIVAAGTSLPEVATSIMAAIKGERDIAVGNVIGSNIFNLLCVLGLTTLASPGGLPISPSVVALDLPVMLAATILCLPLFYIGSSLKRYEGFGLLIGYIVYVAYLILDQTNHSFSPQFNSLVGYYLLPFIFLLLCIHFLRYEITRRKTHNKNK